MVCTCIKCPVALLLEQLCAPWRCAPVFGCTLQVNTLVHILKYYLWISFFGHRKPCTRLLCRAAVRFHVQATICVGICKGLACGHWCFAVLRCASLFRQQFVWAFVRVLHVVIGVVLCCSTLPCAGCNLCGRLSGSHVRECGRPLSMPLALDHVLKEASRI